MNDLLSDKCMASINIKKKGLSTCGRKTKNGSEFCGYHIKNGINNK